MNLAGRLHQVETFKDVADLVEEELKSDAFRKVIRYEEISGTVFMNLDPDELCRILGEQHDLGRLPRGTEEIIRNLQSKVLQEAVRSNDKRLWDTTLQRLTRVGIPPAPVTLPAAPVVAAPAALPAAPVDAAPAPFSAGRLQALFNDMRSRPASGEIVREIVQLMENWQAAASSRNPTPEPDQPTEVLVNFSHKWPFLERGPQAEQMVEGWERSFEQQRVRVPHSASDGQSSNQDRAPYLGLILGPPGVGKTTLAQRLPELVSKPGPLRGCTNAELQEVLQDCMGRSPTTQFAMDVSAKDFSKHWTPLLEFAGREPARWLGLLSFLAWAERCREGTHMETLILSLTEPCFVHLEAHHVWEALHMVHGRAISFLHFVLDEASVLDGQAMLRTRMAFTEIPRQAKRASRNVIVWVTLLSTRIMGDDSAAPRLSSSPTQGDATSKRSRASDLIDKATYSGKSAVCRVFLPQLSRQSAEELLRTTCDMARIQVPKRLPRAASILSEYAGWRPRHIEAMIAAAGGFSTALNKVKVADLRAFMTNCTHERLALACTAVKKLVETQVYFKNGAFRLGEKGKFELQQALVVHSLRGRKVPAKAAIVEGLPVTWSHAVECGHVDNACDDIDLIIPKVPLCVMDMIVCLPEAKLGPVLNVFGDVSSSYHYDDKEVTDLDAIALQLRLAELVGLESETLADVFGLEHRYNEDHPLGMKIKLKGLCLNPKRMRMSSQWTPAEYEARCAEVRDFYHRAAKPKPALPSARPRIKPPAGTRREEQKGVALQKPLTANPQKRGAGIQHHTRELAALLKDGLLQRAAVEAGQEERGDDKMLLAGAGLTSRNLRAEVRKRRAFPSDEGQVESDGAPIPRSGDDGREREGGVKKVLCYGDSATAGVNEQLGGVGGRGESPAQSEHSGSGSSFSKGGRKRCKKEEPAVTSAQGRTSTHLLSPIAEPPCPKSSLMEEEGVDESPLPSQDLEEVNAGAEDTSPPPSVALGAGKEGPVLFWQSVVGAKRPDTFVLLPRAETKSGGSLSPKGAGQPTGYPAKKRKAKAGSKEENLEVVRVEVQSKSNMEKNRGTLSAEEVEVLAAEEHVKQYTPEHPCNLFVLCLDQRIPPDANLPSNTIVFDFTRWRNLYSEFGRFKRLMIDVMQRLGTEAKARVGTYQCPECRKEYTHDSWFVKHLTGQHQMTDRDAAKQVQQALEEAAQI